MYSLIIPNIECVESEGHYGVFVADPLPKGFAVTLGNSLRRVLLAYLPGAAITQVRVEGVLHEFMPVPQAKEDMVEFLLNVKAIRLKPVSGNPGKLFIDVAREGEVKASDIKPSNDFEVVNPDLHLLTLVGNDARLYAEFDVELGTGYREAKADVNLPAGYIPVDAVFSPVRQVNFGVETSTAGEEASSERLRLELQTDATISPQDALAEAANILVEQLLPFSKLSSRTPLKTRTLPEEPGEISVDSLGLSKRVSGSLKRSGVSTVAAIMELGRDRLLEIPNIGGKALQEISDALIRYGLELPLSEAVGADSEAQEASSSGEDEVSQAS